jgi:hypothetical protein
MSMDVAISERETLAAATQEILRATQAFISQYIVLPDEQAAHLLALYVLHTWSTGACDATPYLVVVSAEKGSGKTRLLEVLELLVHKPCRTTSITPAALLRKIHTDRPTLMLDEIDTIFRAGSGHESLRGVLNAGNRRGSFVTRCEGQGVRDWDTFCPKILAGLDTGHLPDTILDRSIVIHMSRQAGSPRFRPSTAVQEVAQLSYALGMWALAVLDYLAVTQPPLPDGLTDRALDAWEPLLAVAQLAGEDWPDRALQAAEAYGTPSIAASSPLQALQAATETLHTSQTPDLPPAAHVFLETKVA